MPGAVNFSTLPLVDGLRRRLRPGLWPARCLACGERGLPGRDLCAACHASLPWNRHACRRCALPLPSLDAADTGQVRNELCGECLARPPNLTQALAACRYGAPLDRWLPRFKFHHDLAAGRLLSQLMAEALADAPKPQALVPVPLHHARLRQRGYDQALELARPLARAFAVPLLPRLLRRVRATAAQSQLDARARRRNLRRAFAVADTRALPAHVALVDDVMTTGATLHAAAEALRRAGVSRVDAWVCARVP